MQPRVIEGTEIDPAVVKVMKAIRQIESGGDYNAVGDAGDARGAFQYNEKTGPGWKNIARQYLGDENAPMDSANQNKATYMRIKEWKDKDFQPEEIAALWNGASKGPNGRYVCNNPDYCKKFIETLTQQKQAAGVPRTQPVTQAGGSYQAPPQPQPFVPAQPPVAPEEKSLGRKAAEFMFPILENKERTNLQTVGDVGLSVASLVPFGGLAGLGAKAAMRGGVGGVLKGLLPKVMSKSAVVKGGVGGYGVDVLSNLSEGDTGTEALTPGLGTAVGVGAPLLARGLKGTKGVQRVLDDEALDTAADIVSPTLTKANVKAGLKRGNVTKGGGVKGDINLGLDTRKQRAAESIKDLVKNGTLKASDTVEKKVGTIRTEIADTAAELEQQLKDMDVVPIIEQDELDNLLKKTEEIFEESPVLVGDAGTSAKRIYKKFVSFIPKGQDVTALDILRARKKLDRWIETEGRTGAFDPKLETAISKGLREIRQGANELLAEKAPNIQTQDMLRKQSAMYDAMDSVIENEWKDVGTTRMGRFLKRNPSIKAGALSVGTGVGSAIGGALGSTYVMNKLNQD